MLARQMRSLLVTDPPTREERERMDAGASDVPAVQTRITVATLNTLQYGRYEANRRGVSAWATARTGLTWDEAVADADGLALLGAGLRWARIGAAVERVETRTVNRVTDEVTDWTPAEWPALKDLDTFVEDTAGDLADALDRLVFDLNPGLFRFEEQDAADAKKNGGISAV